MIDSNCGSVKSTEKYSSFSKSVLFKAGRLLLREVGTCFSIFYSTNILLELFIYWFIY